MSALGLLQFGFSKLSPKQAGGGVPLNSSIAAVSAHLSLLKISANPPSADGTGEQPSLVF